MRNSDGLRDADWKHNAPRGDFHAENDLDNNYVPKDIAQGESKEDLLGRVMYSFRQGVLLPAAPVFDAYAEIMRDIYTRRIEGFVPLTSLHDVGYYARVRMEFLKRLCSEEHGIYQAGVLAPVDGVVHVRGVGRDGEICNYPKGRQDIRVLRPGRTH